MRRQKTSALLTAKGLKEFRKALSNPKFQYTPPKEFKTPNWLRPHEAIQYEVFAVIASMRGE